MKKLVLVSAVFFLMAGTAMAEYVNLAPLYGVASTNATYGSYNAGNAIDGNVDTLWVAGSWQNVTTCQWLIIDLNSTYAVDKIVLHDSPLAQGSSASETFYLYGSANGESWNLIRSGSLVDIDGANSLEIAFALTDMRYIAFDVTEGPNWAHINEIMIYGDDGRTPTRQIAETSSVPEPGTLLLLGLGLFGIAGARRFKK
jgi:hypothetical protein